MIQLTKTQFKPESVHDPAFKTGLRCFICNVDDTLSDDANELAIDYDIAPDDRVGFNQLKNALLVEFLSYCLQKPVAADEVIDSTHLNSEDAKKFNYSSLGESELETLRKENQRLLADNQRLKRELEQKQINDMLYKPQKRAKFQFSSLDEYFDHMFAQSQNRAAEDLPDANLESSRWLFV